MIWGLVKKMIFLGVIVVCMTSAMTYFAPKAFEDNTLKRCSSKTNGFGICAAKPIEKGTPIGLIFTKTGDGVVTYTEHGRTINKNDDGANIRLEPLFLDGGRVDMYGYATRNIEDGEEVLAQKIDFDIKM